MSARHRAEDIDQVSLTDLLDADEHLPRTVLVELSFATSRGDRRITVRRLSDFEESPRPPPRTAPSTTARADCRPAGPTATEGYDAEPEHPTSNTGELDAGDCTNRLQAPTIHHSPFGGFHDAQDRGLDFALEVKSVRRAGVGCTNELDRDSLLRGFVHGAPAVIRLRHTRH